MRGESMNLEDDSPDPILLRRRQRAAKQRRVWLIVGVAAGSVLLLGGVIIAGVVFSGRPSQGREGERWTEVDAAEYLKKKGIVKSYGLSGRLMDPTGLRAVVEWNGHKGSVTINRSGSRESAIQDAKADRGGYAWGLLFFSADPVGDGWCIEGIERALPGGYENHLR